MLLQSGGSASGSSADRELNPKPGSGYGDESYDKYIVPDIIITQTEHGFEMQLSDETLPQIAINPYICY